MIVHRVDVYHQSGWYRRMIPIKDSVLSQNVGQGCFFIVKQHGSVHPLRVHFARADRILIPS